MSIDTSVPRGSAPVPSQGSRPAVSRRSLVRGAVWASPVIALSAPAPAFAASCTQRYGGVLDWAAAAYTRTSTSAAKTSVTFSNGVSTAVTLSSTFTNYTPTSDNLTVTNPVGGTGAAGLTLFQTPNQNGTTGPILNRKPAYFTNNRNNAQVLTIAFSPAVYDVSFLFTDIDSTTGDFIDAVELSMTTPDAGAAPYTALTPLGSTVATGDGSSGSPFRQTLPNVAADNASGVGGNKQILATGPVSSMVIRYYNAIAANGVDDGTSPDQAAFIGKISLAALNTGC